MSAKVYVLKILKLVIQRSLYPWNNKVFMFSSFSSYFQMAYSWMGVGINGGGAGADGGRAENSSKLNKLGVGWKVHRSIDR